MRSLNANDVRSVMLLRLTSNAPNQIHMVNVAGHVSQSQKFEFERDTKSETRDFF